MLASTPRVEAGERGDLAVALEQLRRPPRRRGLAVVISDFIGGRAQAGSDRCARCPPGTTCSPSRCSTRGTWSCRPSAWSPWSTRRPAAPRRSDHCCSCARASRRPPPSTGDRSPPPCAGAGAAQLVLRTDRDWIADVLRFVLTRKRGWTGRRGRRYRIAAPGRPGEVRSPVLVRRSASWSSRWPSATDRAAPHQRGTPCGSPTWNCWRRSHPKRPEPAAAPADRAACWSGWSC